MRNETTLLVLATGFLVVAAALAHGPRWQRRSALLCAVGATALPWWAISNVSLFSGALALWMTWCLGRVIDLTSDWRQRPFGRRLWHVFALVDTRQTSWASPTLDVWALGKTLGCALVATLGLRIVTEVAVQPEGPWYWVLRWVGGALFCYCLADVVEGGVRALYRAVGVVVPRQHVVPIASRSVQEFWGNRWNRVVGGDAGIVSHRLRAGDRRASGWSWRFVRVRSFMRISLSWPWDG